MKRTLRGMGLGIPMLLIATACLAENANQRVVGKKGIGYFSGEAPVGVRYWMSDAMALDIGVGIGVDTQVSVPMSTETTSFFDYAFDIGIPWVLHGEENMIVYFRPGATVVGTEGFTDPTNPNPALASETGYDTAMGFQLGLGGEFFLGQLGWPNLSFAGQVGLGVQVLNPRVDGADTEVSFATFKNDVSVVNTGSIGFHIYF